MTKLFGKRLENKIKQHDADHDRLFMEGYGPMKYWFELPKESEHQIPKSSVHNNRTIELQMLKKVSTRSRDDLVTNIHRQGNTRQEEWREGEAHREKIRGESNPKSQYLLLQ